MTFAGMQRILSRGPALLLGTLACLAFAWSVPRTGRGQEPAGVRPAGSLIRSAPFDRITLTDSSTFDIEPVSPRPLPPYDPSKEKSRKSGTGLRPPREGNIPLPGEKRKGQAEQDKDDEPAPGEVTIHLLQGEARDFKVKRGNIKRIEYFEDMLLAEGDRYRLARDYARGFECVLRVQTRNPN